MTTNEQRSQNDWIQLRCDPTKQVTGFMWAVRRAGWDEQEIANFIEEVFHRSADGLMSAMAQYSRWGTEMEYQQQVDPEYPITPLPPLDKRLKLRYVLQKGNSYADLAGFQVAARWAGWPEADIASVSADCLPKDRKHLLRTLGKYSRTAGQGRAPAKSRLHSAGRRPCGTATGLR